MAPECLVDESHHRQTAKDVIKHFQTTTAPKEKEYWELIKTLPSCCDVPRGGITRNYQEAKAADERMWGAK